jgi:hypothetical protein
MVKSTIKEKDIQYGILIWLCYKGIFCWRTNSGSAFYPKKGGGTRMINFGIPGISDIIGVLPDGKFLAIEVKRPDGKLTEAQSNFIFEVNRRGGIAFVARSIDDVKDRLCIGGS